MNEFDPQQTPQEPQAAETPAAETIAADVSAAEAPAAVETPLEAQSASAPESPAAVAAAPETEPAPEAPAEPAPKQQAARPPAAGRPPQEQRNARAAQKNAQADRARAQTAAPRNARAQAQPRESARAERGRSPEGPIEIDLEKLIADSLYLDNQAHAIVARMRDMDSGTRSQLRRLFSAVRRACRTAESERQHAFVMLRARLAYTIARHQLRSLDPLEKLLLQVTRKNDARGYERFRDLFEAIVAYNE
jgi:CRISPR type III-A-associated protein Csm2